MGLDIGVNEYDGDKWVRTPSYRWDGRLVGERAFAAASIGHVYREGGDPYDYPDWRPADFGEARAWVSASAEIPDCNKAQFLRLLDALEANPNLWVYVSV